MNIQDQIDKAEKLAGEGKATEALGVYSGALDHLVKESVQYAHSVPENFEETTKNGKKVKKILPQALESSKKYLKQDKSVAVISFNMGVIYAQTGERELAKEFLKQAIELTPDDEEYEDPKRALEALEEF